MNALAEYYADIIEICYCPYIRFQKLLIATGAGLQKPPWKPNHQAMLLNY
jgi:hypothetical protein